MSMSTLEAMGVRVVNVDLKGAVYVDTKLPVVMADLNLPEDEIEDRALALLLGLE